MSNPISYIKSSGGSVDAKVMGDLTGAAAASVLEYVNGSDNLINEDKWVYGKYMNKDGSTVDDEQWRYVVVPVAPNTSYTVSYIAYYAIWLDASGKVDAYDATYTDTTNYTFTTSDHAAFVVLQQKHASANAMHSIMVRGTEIPRYFPSFSPRSGDSARAAASVLEYVNASVNLYDESQAIYGYYIENTGKPVENKRFRYVIIPVMPGTDYIVSHVGYAVIEMDVHGEVTHIVKTYTETDNVQFTTNTNTAYIAVSNTVYGSNIMVVRGTKLPGIYVPFGLRSNTLDKGRVLRVYPSGTANGSTTFTSVVDALRVAANTKGHKTVYIYAGEYDILEEIGGMSYVSSFDNKEAKWEDVQPVVDDCDIIGLGRVVLNFMLDAPTGDAYWLFSCLNVRGNMHIENIEIHSQNCRYCIHDESGSNFPNTTREYVNVRAYQNEAGGTAGGQAIGCGFSENTSVHMRDCIMRADTWAWSCHANNGCSCVYDNCAFIINSDVNRPALRVSQNGNPTSKEYVRLSNCIVQNGIELRHEWAENQSCQTKVDAFNTKLTVTNGYASVSDPTTVYDLSTGQVTTILAAD